MQLVKFRVTGVSPLLQNNPAKMQEKKVETVSTKKKYDPAEQAEASVYKNERGEIYIPAVAFRSALLKACTGRKVGKMSAATAVQAAVFPTEERCVLVDAKGKPIKKYEIHSCRVVVMQAGVELPPLVICAKSRRIVDGVHRLHAAIRRKGPTAGVEVVEKTYKNDAELLLDAIRYNAKHGRPLRDDDRRLCAKLGSDAGLKTEEIAAVLGVRAAAIGPLTVAKTSAVLTLATGIRPQAEPVRYQDDDDDVDGSSDEVEYKPLFGRSPAPAGIRSSGGATSLIERIARQQPGGKRTGAATNGRDRRGSGSIDALAQMIVSAAVEWYTAKPAEIEGKMTELTESIERYLKAHERCKQQHGD